MTPLDRRTVEASPFNASTPLAALAEDVTPTRLHYVRNHFAVPRVDDADAWPLTVDGRVAAPREWTLAELRRLAPERAVTVTLECAGNGRTRMQPQPPGTPWDEGAVSTATFTGIPLAALLEEARLADDARHVLFRGADEGDVHGKRIAFERALPVAKAQEPTTLLAWTMNGEPLPPDHGFPLRVIVPGWYGVASVKWLTRITLLDRPFDGHYQVDRYTYDGEQPEGEAPEPVAAMRVKSLVHAPADGAHVPAGEAVTIRGRAWGGTGGVARVDVSVDGGATWAPAALAEAVGAPEHAWRAFTFPWTPTTRGAHTVLARAVDAAGNAQPMTPPWNAHGYGMNAVLPVRVHVA